MSISKHKNTLKRLIRINAEQNPIHYVSVVYMDNKTGQIICPGVPNPSGVLVTMKPQTIQEWLDAGINKN